MNTNFKPGRQDGFTIVELMVGVLIGMIAIVVMFQVFAVAEAQKRTAAGAGDAQQEGVSSLYLLERDVRMAGYGLNYFPMLGCTVNGYWAPSGKNIQFSLTPTLIANGAAGAPDSLTIVYSGTDTFAVPGVISPPNSTDKTPGYVTLMDARYQYKTGDVIVIGEIPPAGAPIAKPCSMFQVTGLPSGGQATWLQFSGSSYIDDNGVNNPANYSPPTASASVEPATPGTYYAYWTKSTQTGGRIADLGRAPTVVKYSIVNNQLVVTDLMQPDNPPTPIADNIAQFQVQYGFSSGCQMNPAAIVPCTISPTAASVATLNFAAGQPDQWGDSLPAGYTMLPADWRRLIAIRLIIVARSNNREKPNPATGQCTATTVLPKWGVNGATVDVSLTTPVGDDWKCYRYKTFETIVPIRNLIWFPDPNGTSVDPAAS